MDATREAGMLALVTLARWHGVPVEPGQLASRFGVRGEPPSVTDLVRAARWLGLRARAIRASWARLAHLPLPALVRWRGGGSAVLAGVRADEVLVKHAHEPGPRVLSRREFEAQWAGDVVLVTRRLPADGDPARFGLCWLVRACLRLRRPFADVLIASAVLQLLALVAPLCFQVVIDKVLVHHGLATLDVLCAALAITVLFETTLGAVRNALLAHTAARVDARLGRSVFRHLLALPSAYFAARRVGDTVARVRELEQVRAVLTGSALLLAVELPFALVCGALLAWYDASLAVLVFASVPLQILLVLALTPALRAALDDRCRRGAEAQTFLIETISGIDTVKTAAAESVHVRRWEDLLAAVARANLRAVGHGNTLQQLSVLVQRAVMLGVLWIGARHVIGGSLTVGGLVAFNLLAGRAIAPLQRLAPIWQEWQGTFVAMRRLADVMHAPAERVDGPAGAVLPGVRGRITFEHVAFRHAAERPDVLHDLCFEIAPGQVVGLCGRSGSGKSTLLRILQGLYAPTRGRVLFDGHDVATLDLAWLRGQIGVVGQDARLFERSIRDNIALRDPGLPFARIEAAARLAGAHEFIVALPEGYDTRVGEEGHALSGGERQRIALARALANDPRILVLDEATSALDHDAEDSLQARMPQLARGRTVIIAAHRLTALRHADTVMVIEAGRIAEAGTPAELLARGGYYARLRKLQAIPPEGPPSRRTPGGESDD
ncbi:MAG: peptidase domain-containing ABC transporter [Gammaproteobacteria bacterium]